MACRPERLHVDAVARLICGAIVLDSRLRRAFCHVQECDAFFTHLQHQRAQRSGRELTQLHRRGTCTVAVGVTVRMIRVRVKYVPAQQACAMHGTQMSLNVTQ
jgi:hypothetical protein